MSIRIVTAEDRPDLVDKMHEVTGSTAVWPEFMLHDTIANDYWWQLYQVFPAFQFALIDEEETVYSVGNTIPLQYDGPVELLPEMGWDWAMLSGFADHGIGAEPTVLSALSITIPPERQGQGISTKMVSTMKEIAHKHGLRTLIAPVRPTHKARYPLIPMADYITWQRDDGLPTDPWLRVHVRLSGRIVRVCERSMIIAGAVEEWAEWTGMIFPQDGTYIVPGALTPVTVNDGRATYIEPNVWIEHA